MEKKKEKSEEQKESYIPSFFDVLVHYIWNVIIWLPVTIWHSITDD